MSQTEKTDSRNKLQKLYDANYAPKVSPLSKKPLDIIPKNQHNIHSSSRPKKHYAPLIKKNRVNPEIFDALESLEKAKIEKLKEFSYF